MAAIRASSSAARSGRATRPLAQALYVTRLREVESAQNRKADDGREPGVGADLLNVMHTPWEP